MATVTFYEKPGCSGNAKQKKILEAAGHTVVARNLLGTPWTRLELLSYFDGLPIAQWFNRNSPAIKSGEIVPEECDEATAVALLQRYPLLIRRPLLEVDGERKVGFDAAAIDAWIGLGSTLPEDDLEACRHGADGHVCAGHDHEHGAGCND
ncbi:MAG TPA: ArsC/Spx/MgsR family protein [Rhodocyclaceae bacterium]|nr:ArsC/Spx/MgsR family protein [Rhodocyclaceae bacterium]